MISVLIPVYNYDISSLVNCLHQAFDGTEEFREILIGADGCDQAHLKSYQPLEKLEGVRLIINQENIGRAGIRNRLAENASGDNLLYIDADALIEGNALPYIERYVRSLNLAPVICGGTAYRSVPPMIQTGT
ncbi:MAG: glycosyltransferase family A protein [Bacteroidales bacterium]